MLELGVPIRMALQTVAELMEQFRSLGGTDGMPGLVEFPGQSANDFTGPEQRAHRIAPRVRADQTFQSAQQFRLALRQGLAAATRAADPLATHYRRWQVGQFSHAAPDGVDRQLGSRRDVSHPTPTRRLWPPRQPTVGGTAR